MWLGINVIQFIFVHNESSGKIIVVRINATQRLGFKAECVVLEDTLYKLYYPVETFDPLS